MKKQITLYFLFLACFLQLGHSLFPHTHIEEHRHNGEHHHHDNDLNQNNLSLFFSHFSHTSDIFSNNHVEEVVKVANKIPNTIFVVNSNSNYSYFLPFYSIREIQHQKEPLVFISPYLYSLQFRGPPALS